MRTLPAQFAAKPPALPRPTDCPAPAHTPRSGVTHDQPRTEAGMEWIPTPAQQRQRYLDALRALRRPCDCPDRCAVQERWWFAIDGVLDAWLESERLMGAR